MRHYDDNAVRSCFFQLRQLRSVRRSLTDEALHTIVHAFIARCVDYCNALPYGVADGVIRRLQSVLHAAARLIAGIRRYEHITPTLRDTSLAADITAHHLQNCADDVRLFSWPMSEVLW